MITIYTMTWNEEFLIQFMIDHYQERLPHCQIVVNDNMSTDNTVKIAKAKGCKIVPFDTGGQMQDCRNMEIKNTCWKTATTDWVLMCDLDELVDINEAELKAEENLGTSIIRFQVYDMINMKKNNIDFAGMKYGVKSPIHSKLFLFNKKFISEINYGPGAHTADPVGTIRYSSKVYKVYHYASINEDLTIERFGIRRKRLSPENIKMGWGIQLLMTPEEICQEYAEERTKAVKVR